ncbi:MAG: restriction endonuclease subunit S, partial [Candidatus Gastranaerophilales bacterium]|nr:restriction endonuclease subunit S [Candidatus Gastranaerophilales bacterium]
MKKYKLGDLIRKVEGNKNKQLKDLPLLGINIEKEFMPSVANTIGTDMSNYQIVKKEQFACNPMHLGRDERMPTALLLDRDEILVSPAYFVFEIIDKNIILPEYLMLYFKRPETDRLLWFKTDSSVRGGLGWNEFCAVELFIPSIEKQKKIVEQYNQITESIRIKERLNNNLEQQAQAIFKSWFVDFEPFNRVMPSNWEISDIYNVADIIYGAP